MKIFSDSKNRAVLIGLLLFAFFFRTATLMMIHTGIDERDYWFSAKTLANHLPYPDISHRTTRFAVILPVAAAQALLGSHPDVYYVIPLLNGLVQAALAFAIGLRLRGRLAGFLAGLGLVLFPYMIRAGSQVRPEIFSITYVLAALLCLLHYFEEPRRPLVALGWTAAWLFVAYEAKLTNLYFVAGAMVAIVAYRRKVGHAVFLGGIVLGLFLLETGMYAALTPYKFGALQIILRNHIDAGAPFVVARLADLFQRYSGRYLQPYWQIPFVAFAGAALYYLVRNRDERIGAVSITTLMFFLGITFEVARLHPLMPAEPFINRYFSAVLGPVFVILGCAGRGVLLRVFPGARPAAEERAWPYGLALALGAVAVLGLFSVPRLLPAGVRAYANSPLKPREHPLVLAERYRRAVNAAYRDGTPIVAVDGIGGRNAIETAEAYFLDLSFYRNRELPEIVRFQSGGSSYFRIASIQESAPADHLLAAVRTPFRVIPIPASGLGQLTSSSVQGTTASADEDEDQ